MAEKKPSINIRDRLGDSFRLDGDIPVFSIVEFLRGNYWPDDPQLRRVVIAEMRELYPKVRVLEDEQLI